jgi:hypothetical protein
MLQLILMMTLAWGLLPCPAPAFFCETQAAAAAPALPPGQGSATPTKQPCPRNPSERLLLTRDTEIRLDGRLCSYEQVPPGAVITFAEVDSDRQTLLRIHYRSPR